MKSEDLYLKAMGIPEIYSGRTYVKASDVKGKFQIDEKIVVKVTTVFIDGEPKKSEKGNYWTKKIVFIPILQKDEKFICATTSQYIWDVVKNLDYEEKVETEHKKFLTSTEKIEGEFSFIEKPKDYAGKSYDILAFKFE